MRGPAATPGVPFFALYKKPGTSHTSLNNSELHVIPTRLMLLLFSTRCNVVLQTFGGGVGLGILLLRISASRCFFRSNSVLFFRERCRTEQKLKLLRRSSVLADLLRETL